jgi:hypothetical protein
MRQNSVWAFVAGTLLTGAVLSVFVWELYPSEFFVYAFPLYVFEILLWLNGYRVSRKKQAG